MENEWNREKRVCVYGKEMLEDFLVFEEPYFMDAHSDLDFHIYSINLVPQHPSVAKQYYDCFTDGMLRQT